MDLSRWSIKKNETTLEHTNNDLIVELTMTNNSY